MNQGFSSQEFGGWSPGDRRWEWAGRREGGGIRKGEEAINQDLGDGSPEVFYAINTVLFHVLTLAEGQWWGLGTEGAGGSDLVILSALASAPSPRV